jgi:hypothetical protein
MEKTAVQYAWDLASNNTVCLCIPLEKRLFFTWPSLLRLKYSFLSPIEELPSPQSITVN